MSDHITKDSGERRAFSTGSVRDAATGKGRFDLISPIALERLALMYERGAAKYDDRNWEKGQPVTRVMDCALRHLNKHLAGWRDEDHLAAALWNVAAMIHIEHQCARGKLPAELIDWPAAYVTEEDAGGPVFQRGAGTIDDCRGDALEYFTCTGSIRMR